MTGKGSLRSTAFARLFDDWGTQPRQAREQYVALVMNVKSFLQGPVEAKVPQKPGAAVPARREVILRTWRTSSYPGCPQERHRVKALRGGVWPHGSHCTPNFLERYCQHGFRFERTRSLGPQRQSCRAETSGR